MTRVIGVDTGGRWTGVGVLWRDSGGRVLPLTALELTGTVEEQLAQLGAVVQRGDLVAGERWTNRMRAGRSSNAAAGERTRQLLGGLQEICRARGAQFVMRSAGTVKPWGTDRRLRAAGLWDSSRHTRDGFRHALYAAVSVRGWPDPLSSAWRH
jgi:hypothetical protein